MPAKKKAAPAAKKSTALDIDALLAEAGFVEPDKITLRWRGEDWEMTPVSAIDPRLLSDMASVDGLVKIIEAGLGEEQFARFPMPRAVELPDGTTEMGLFLDAWADASGETADPGE